MPSYLAWQQTNWCRIQLEFVRFEIGPMIRNSKGNYRSRVGLSMITIFTISGILFSAAYLH